MVNLCLQATRYIFSEKYHNSLSFAGGVLRCPILSWRSVIQETPDLKTNSLWENHSYKNCVHLQNLVLSKAVEGIRLLKLSAIGPKYSAIQDYHWRIAWD